MTETADLFLFAFSAAAMRSLAEREAILRVGDAVRRVITKAGLKHEAVAALMQTSPSELSKELNERGVRLSRLALIGPTFLAQVWAELDPQPDLPARVDALEVRVSALERRRA